MNKQAFKRLFEEALETAARNADAHLGQEAPRAFRIRLGSPRSGDLLPPDAALDRLYLGEDRFYAIIDVAVIAVDKQWTTVLLRPSGHAPARFEQTWNNPPGSGPFKQLISAEIAATESGDHSLRTA